MKKCRMNPQGFFSDQVMGPARSILLVAAFAVSAAAALSPPSPDAGVMLELKKSLTPLPTRLSDWNDKNDTCTWTGVKCNDHGRVWRIVIFNSNLTRTLPESLGNLTELIVFNVSNNRLTGKIPDFSRSVGLEKLIVDRNSFTSFSPELFVSKRNLTIVALDYNLALRPWKIPDTLKCASNLKSFTAPNSNMVGQIPEFINGANFPKLKELELPNNNLSGPLPSNLPKSLMFVGLSNQGGPDKLWGNISVIGGLTRLTQLFLHSNQFSGPIPDLSRLLSLKELTLGSNRLTGPIPDSMGSLPSLLEVNLANNNLSGCIPESLTRSTQLQTLIISNNKLTGSIPQFSTGTQFRILVLSNNLLTGYIPPSIANLASLTSLDLSNNQLSGDIPQTLNLTSLLILDVSKNQLTGCIPESFENLNHLLTLNVSHNRLNGSIPQTLANINSLGTLDVSNNGFTGSIPQNLVNVTSLWTLDVSNNQLSGDVPDFPQSRLTLTTCGNLRLSSDKGKKCESSG